MSMTPDEGFINLTMHILTTMEIIIQNHIFISEMMIMMKMEVLYSI